MVLISIGYHGREIPNVPFDKEKGVILNREGRVISGETGEIIVNQYVVGWAMTGPRGLIGTQRAISDGVVREMLGDVEAGAVPPSPVEGRQAMRKLLEERGVQHVSFEDWKTIDELEVARGKSRGAPRVKFTDVSEMLDALSEKKRES